VFAPFETVHGAESMLRAHTHHDAYVSIVLDGTYTEVVGAVPDLCPRGALIVHGPDEEHADYFHHDGARCLNVPLDAASVPVLPRRIVPTQPHLRAAADAVVRAFYGGAPGDVVEAAVAALRAALAGVTRAPAVPVPAWLQAALGAFEWVEPVPLERAAALGGVHQTHFSRAFRRHLGVTPSAYRRRARVRRASELLLTTSLAAAAVAQRCGFSDQSHLTHAFALEVGVAPAAYRRLFAR